MKGEGRKRKRDGKACVAVVTGTLHRNDFNRSSDTLTHIHRFLQREKMVKDTQRCTDRLML